MNGAVNYDVHSVPRNGEICPFQEVNRFGQSPVVCLDRPDFPTVPRYEDMLTGAARTYVSLLYRRKTVIRYLRRLGLLCGSLVLHYLYPEILYAKLFACILTHVICVKRSARRKVVLAGYQARRSPSTRRRDWNFDRGCSIPVYIREL